MDSLGRSSPTILTEKFVPALSSISACFANAMAQKLFKDAGFPHHHSHEDSYGDR